MPQRQTFDISFYCRPSKVDKNGYAPVELSIIINGERRYLTLQRKEHPDEFKREMQSKKVNQIKNFCENQKRLVDDYVQQMASAGVELTAANLRECLMRGYVSMRYSLGDLWRDILDNARERLKVGDLSMETYKKYILTKKALSEANGFSDETPAEDVDIQHVHKLQYYLRDKGLSQPTIYHYHSRAKAAFTLAFQRGKIKSNPYAGFKISKGAHKPRVFLTEKELQQIATAKLNGDRLVKVRDLFLFQCYSGLAYSDMALLDPSDFKFNKDTNQIYVEKRRKKTNEVFTAVLLKDAKAILEKYDYRLPLLTNQKYNSYLKEIQDACGLEKELHTHLGRTTYVCYLFNKGVSADVIAKLVGHSTTKTTLRFYAEMDKSTLFREVGAAEGTPKTSTKGIALPEIPSEAAITAINKYLESTVYKDTLAVPTNATLVKYEDTIMNALVALKSDKRTYETYKVAFAKCKNNLDTRLSFLEGKLRQCKKAGDDANVRKLNLLIKSGKRLGQALRSLDARFYNNL